jgi:hypothetical protein
MPIGVFPLFCLNNLNKELSKDMAYSFGGIESSVKDILTNKTS